MPPVARPLKSLTADEITVRKGQVIGKAGERDLHGDLYLPLTVPPIAPEARPALVILHGGGWRKGSTRGVSGYGEQLSRMGFVCVCPDYRLSGEALWPAQIEDVKCAIRYLRASGSELGVDPDRIGVFGDSAGGHLALMAAATEQFEGSGGHASQSSIVHAVGATYAPVRVPKKRGDGAPTDGAPTGLFDASATDEDYATASPLGYDLTEFPPCLLIHGTADQGVPLTGTMELHSKLTQYGRAVDLHLFAEEGHAFDRRQPGQDRMVDIADPSSIYGLTVVRLVGHFFTKYL